MNKDTFWFKHDSNASQDPKMIALTSVYGFEGYGRFWRIIEMIREQEGYKLDISSKYAFKMFASMLMFASEDKAREFIYDCVHEFDLLQMDEDHLWSDALCRRMQAWDKKKEQAKKAVEARWKKKKNTSKKESKSAEKAPKIEQKPEESPLENDTDLYDRDTDVLHPYNERNTIREEKTREDKSREEKNREDKSRISKKERDFFGENEISAALESIEEQKDQLTKPPASKKRKGPRNTKLFVDKKSLHSKAKARFTHWHQLKFPNSPDFYWSPKEIGQLTRFLKMLQFSATSKGTTWETDDEFISKVFDVFCQRFFDSKAWFSDTFTPSAIVSNFNRIVQTISNPRKHERANPKVTDDFKAGVLERLSRVATVG